MRRIAIWIAATVTIVVLLFGYHTSTNRSAAIGAATTPISGQQPSSGSETSTGPASPTQSSGSPRSSKSTKSTASTSKRSFTGDVAQTERGPVQVEVVVSNKKITDVKILQVPTEDPMDVRINQFAVPILIQETITAQSAKIDMVSGATVTSDGYVQSLQSALDRAGI